jgi:hypothetical protein
LGIDDRIEQLRTLKTGINDVRDVVGVTKLQFDQMMSEGLTGVLSEFGQSIGRVIGGFGNLSDAFANAGRAFQQFASNFLIKIGEMILQTIIFNQLKRSGFGNIFNFSGVPQTEQSAMLAQQNAGLMHVGGVAGSAAPMNATFDPSVFTNAVRYHTGGIAGLRPDEVPTVLQKGEEVLTRDDPRHRYNGGATSGTEVNIIDQRGAGAPPVEVQRSNVDGMEQIKVFIKEQVAGLMNTGGLDTTMATTFNITRTGVRR